MRKQLLHVFFAVLVVSTFAWTAQASIQLVAIGDPVIGDSWSQTFELSGTSPDPIAEMYVNWKAGATFEVTAIRDLPVTTPDAWAPWSPYNTTTLCSMTPKGLNPTTWNIPASELLWLPITFNVVFNSPVAYTQFYFAAYGAVTRPYPKNTTS